MDCTKIGRLIAGLRREKGLTQQNLADALGVSNKTISKWECGLGCPDLSLWSDLSVILGVGMEDLMEGDIRKNRPDTGNIRRMRFYVCPDCGNILFSTSNASLCCCGRRLEPLTPTAENAPAVQVREIDLSTYITFDHPMEKSHALTFAAWVRYDTVYLRRLYPEQESAVSFPLLRGGTLYLYCPRHGLHAYEKLF